MSKIHYVFVHDRQNEVTVWSKIPSRYPSINKNCDRLVDAITKKKKKKKKDSGMRRKVVKKNDLRFSILIQSSRVYIAVSTLGIEKPLPFALLDVIDLDLNNNPGQISSEKKGRRYLDRKLDEFVLEMDGPKFSIQNVKKELLDEMRNAEDVDDAKMKMGRVYERKAKEAVESTLRGMERPTDISEQARLLAGTGVDGTVEFQRFAPNNRKKIAAFGGLGIGSICVGLIVLVFILFTLIGGVVILGCLFIAICGIIVGSIFCCGCIKK